MSRRSAIGDNPLDSIIALPSPGGAAPMEPEAVGEHSNGSRRTPEVQGPRVTSQKPGAGGLKRTRLTVKVADGMVEELRDAVMFLHTKGVHTTLVGIIESAVETELARIKSEYNESEDLPRRGADLPAGRPISA